MLSAQYISSVKLRRNSGKTFTILKKDLTKEELFFMQITDMHTKAVT